MSKKSENMVQESFIYHYSEIFGRNFSETIDNLHRIEKSFRELGHDGEIFVDCDLYEEYREAVFEIKMWSFRPETEEETLAREEKEAKAKKKKRDAAKKRKEKEKEKEIKELKRLAKKYGDPSKL